MVTPFNANSLKAAGKVSDSSPQTSGLQPLPISLRDGTRHAVKSMDQKANPAIGTASGKAFHSIDGFYQGSEISKTNRSVPPAAKATVSHEIIDRQKILLTQLDDAISLWSMSGSFDENMDALLILSTMQEDLQNIIDSSRAGLNPSSEFNADLSEINQSAASLLNTLKEKAAANKEKIQNAVFSQQALHSLEGENLASICRCLDSLDSRVLDSIPEKPSIAIQAPQQGGIPNIGNSCYMNSGVQALNGIPNLGEIIKKNLVRQPGESDERFNVRSAIQVKLQNVMKAMKEGNPSTVENAMRDLRSLLFSDNVRKNLVSDFMPNEMLRQQDGYAFLSIIYQALAIDFQLVSRPADARSELSEHCTAIGLPRGDNLQDSFNQYFSSSGAKFSEIPEIITVQLPRFFPEGGKDERALSCPNGGRVDLTKFVKPEILKGQKAIYRITGFQIHHGANPRSGHYTACHQDKNGQWWHCNDSVKTPISTKEAERLMGQGYNAILVREK